MKLGTLLGEASRNIVATKQRSLLALLGIVIGTASVIAMLNVGSIMHNAVLEQFRSMGTNVINIRQQLFFDEDAPTRNKLDLELAHALGPAMPQLLQVAPFNSTSSELRAGTENQSVRVTGASESLQDLLRVNLSAGRWTSELDGVELHGVVGSEVASNYSMRTNQILGVGERVQLGDYTMTVVGVLKPYPRGSGVSSISPNQTIFLPIESLQRFDANIELEGVLARVAPEANHQKLARDIEAWVEGRAPGLAIDINSAEQLLANMEQQSRMFTLMLGAIGSIALIVGGVGIMNIMLVSVTERRKEIGIRLAIGARSADIRQQFLVEAIMLCLLGGVIGAVLGTGVAIVFAHLTGNPFVAAPIAVLLGVSVSTLTGIAFGYYPALQASRLDPIIALRSE